jgi:hypothetical protein
VAIYICVLGWAGAERLIFCCFRLDDLPKFTCTEKRSQSGVVCVQACSCIVLCICLRSTWHAPAYLGSSATLLIIYHAMVIMILIMCQCVCIAA